MEKNSGEFKSVNLVYKQLGETPNEAIVRFKKENPEYDFLPMTYAGRLDPMAEGLLILLSEGELNKKEKYLALPKVYEFEILWGFTTDTLDILGKVTTYDGKIPEELDVVNMVGESVGKHEQMYPAYSSRPVGGKSLFEWARAGKIGDIELPKHDVEILACNFIERREINGEELLTEIVRRVNLVKGDFRQGEIIALWESYLKNKAKDKFVIDKASIEVTSGFYVRQFVSDLAKTLGCTGLAFHIKRISVGNYTIE